MKNQEVIDRILDYHPKLMNYRGCDGYKVGSGEDECKGVAVALVPTADVLERAVEQNCNLIITHEPIFYQTPDFPGWMGSFKNSVYEQKKDYIKEHGLTVWRDHDHMHAHYPDSIFYGVIRELGWENYYEEDKEHPAVFKFTFPETTVEEIANKLKNTLHLNGLKYLGDLHKKVTRVAIVGHLFPNCFYQDGVKEDEYYHDYALDIMKQMEEDGVEVIIPGEIIEWTVVSYIRDGIYQGKNMACISIGHFNLEELGMKDFARVLGDLVEKKVPVTYLPTKDGFSYL